METVPTLRVITQISAQTKKNKNKNSKDIDLATLIDSLKKAHLSFITSWDHRNIVLLKV